MVQFIRLLAFLIIFAASAQADYKKLIDQSQGVWQQARKYARGPVDMSLNQLINGGKAYGTLGTLREYRVKAANFAIADAAGDGAGSGVEYIPILDLWLIADNNETNGHIHIFQGDDLSTEWGNWNVINNSYGASGLGDTEWVAVLGIQNDANGAPDNVILAIGEESCSVGQGCTAGSQVFHLCTVDLQTATQSIDTTNASQCTTIKPSSMWTNDTSLGWEAGCYDSTRKSLWGFKQDTAFEARLIPLDGTTSPVASEPWDAETILSATLPAINDCHYDANTDTIILIGDATGADDSNQDLVRVDASTGAVVENLQSYVTGMGLNVDTRTDWPQGEGFACTPDMSQCMVGSEQDNVALLERIPPGSYYTDLYIDPSDAVLDDTAPPTAAVVESTGTGTPRRNTLAFADVADDIAYLSFIVPQEFRVAGNSIVLETYWYANSTTAAQDAIWSAQISCTTAADADSMAEDAATAAAAAMTVATNVNTTEANRLLTSSISLATDDSVAAGDYCTIVFLRDADDTIGNADNDGLTVDANVVGWRLRLPRF